jgi:hypothetical protein
MNFAQIATIASEIEKSISGVDHALKQLDQIDFKNISPRLISILSKLDD